MATTTFSTAKVQNLLTMTNLVKEIITLTEAIKERETLLADKKKQLASILPNDEIFRIKDDTDETKVIEAKWNDKITKTLQKALVEQNHGITIDDADYKTTPSHFVTVAKVKA